MAADARIVFRADGKQAQQELQKLQKEIAELRQSLGQTQRSADAAEKGYCSNWAVSLGKRQVACRRALEKKIECCS